MKRQDTLRESLKLERKVQREIDEGEIHEEDAEEELAALRAPLGNIVGAIFLFCFWILLGAVFATVSQYNWGPPKSLEYAVTALSTGGLQALQTHQHYKCSPHPQLFHGDALFCTFYIATGIPIFGLVMGKLADILTDSQLEAERDAEEILEEAIEKDISEKGQSDLISEHKAPDEIMILREVEALKLDQLPLRQVHVKDEDCLTCKPDEDAYEQDVEVNFTNFFLLEALEDSKIDMRYLKSVKRKYNRLQESQGSSVVPSSSNQPGSVFGLHANADDAGKPEAATRSATG